MPEKMPERMSEYMLDRMPAYMPERMTDHCDRMSEKLCHKNFQTVCQKLCHNSASGWRSLEVFYGYCIYFSLYLYVAIIIVVNVCPFCLILSALTEPSYESYVTYQFY